MFAADTPVVGHMSSNDEMEYRKDIENLITWCQDNNFFLKVSKRPFIRLIVWGGG